MKARTLLFLPTLCLFAGLASGQNSFQKTYGGPGTDIANNLLALQDGYLVAGTSSSFGDGSLDGYLLRLGPDGDIVWQKVYGTASNDVFTAVTEANGGGFLAVGFTTSGFLGSQDIMITRLDDSGNVLWNKISGGGADDYARAVIRIADGYIISGGQSSISSGTVDGFVMRINNNGNMIWTRSYAGSISNILLVEYEENGILFGGGGADAAGAFIRLSAADGSILSAQLADGGSTEALYYIRPTNDGNLVQSDHSWSPSGGTQIRQWTRKIDKSGNVLWSKTYSAAGADLRGRTEPCADGGFLITPYDNFNKPTAEPVMVRLDSAGNVLWSYRYGGAALDRLYKGEQTADGGFIAAGQTRSAGSFGDDDILLLKTKPNGLVDGCCIEPYSISTEEYTPAITDFGVSAYSFIGVLSQFQFGLFTLLSESAACFNPAPVVKDTLIFCAGDTILIGGQPYANPGIIQTTLPGLPGCDTLAYYTLIKTPLPTKSETIERCAGESVVIGGNTYTQNTTVTATLPATTGCDTLVTYTLLFKPLPTRSQTVEFCPGSSIVVNGVTFTQPGTTTATLPSATACDTVLTYVVQYYSLPQPSNLSVNCPAAITVDAALGADSAPVSYAAPTGSSDCICDGYGITLLQGLPSGSQFPVGATQVCYRAQDSCGSANSCCFQVTVNEADEPCDLKTLGCAKFELLSITADAARRHTYRIRVTNNCSNKMMYFAAQVPNGVTAFAPANNAIFSSEGGREYVVRNPNFSPFYSIKFTPVADGLVSGQSDIFKYTLPTQANNPWYIHVVVRLQFSEFISTHLNTFYCPVGVTPPNAQNRQEPEITEAGEPLIFPNPASDAIQIDLSSWPHVPTHARIFNAQGRLILENNTPQDADIIGFDLPAEWYEGVYFLEITAEDGARSVKRFIKLGGE